VSYVLINIIYLFDYWYLGKLYAHQVIRTDSRERKLDAFFTPQINTLASQSNVMSRCTLTDETISVDDGELNVDDMSIAVSREPDQTSKTSTLGSSAESSLVSETAVRREIKLTSVLQLKQSIESNMHEG